MTGNNSETCLICNRKRSKRGLCPKHYERFRRAQQSLPEALKAKFENQLMESGKLLAANYGGKLQDDEFASLAQQLIAESNPETRMSDAEIADAEAAKLRAKLKSPVVIINHGGINTESTETPMAAKGKRIPKRKSN